MPVNKVPKNSQVTDSDLVAKKEPSTANTTSSSKESVRFSDIQRLAQDLMKTHGQKFANLFGTSFFGSQVYQKEEERKRRQESLKQKGPIKRILVSSENDIRSLVKECLDPMYQKEEIIEALTSYLCNHYEMFYETHLPREA